jgi:hypothetical protein
MKKLIYFFPSFFLLQSCGISDDGVPCITPLGWFIIVAILVFIFFVGRNQSKKIEATKKEMARDNLDFDQFTNLGTYAGGHPDINDSIENISIKKEGDVFKLYIVSPLHDKVPELIPSSEIPINDINDITIEDASSIEKKITVGRIFLVGIFALGWRKKKKEELSFLVIDWKKGKFNHSTIFSFTGKDSFTAANIARNKLISFCE